MDVLRRYVTALLIMLSVKASFALAYVGMTGGWKALSDPCNLDPVWRREWPSDHPNKDTLLCEAPVEAVLKELGLTDWLNMALRGLAAAHLVTNPGIGSAIENVMAWAADLFGRISYSQILCVGAGLLYLNSDGPLQFVADTAVLLFFYELICPANALFLFDRALTTRPIKLCPPTISPEMMAELLEMEREGARLKQNATQKT